MFPPLNINSIDLRNNTKWYMLSRMRKTRIRVNRILYFTASTSQLQMNAKDGEHDLEILTSNVKKHPSFLMFQYNRKITDVMSSCHAMLLF